MCCKSFKKKLGSDLHECFSNSTSVKEKGKEFRIENISSDDICKLQIDDCFIKSKEEIKCDYLFYFCKTEEIFLVELKGTDIEHALKQVIATFKKINNYLKFSSKKYTGFIVSSSVPKATEQRFRKAQENILKQEGLLIKKVHLKSVVKK